MGVQINKEQALAKTSMVYNNVFLVRLDIRQEHADLDSDHPEFRVTVKYRMYGVDGDGKRHYSGEGIKAVTFKDFLTVAAQKAGGGDLALLNSFTGIQEAVAAIVADDRKTTATII